jgi:glutamate/tyrosine decarboxylase-like PLP-dependent enzyme
MRSLLHQVADNAAEFLESLPDRHVGVTASVQDLFAALDKPLLESPLPPASVLRDMVRDIDPGLVASASGRYFGFVIGGATPASIAADWLTSAWDQCAQVYATSPAAAVVEEIVARWIVDLLGLPAESSVGFVSGCQMANFTALSAARNAVLTRTGWDLDGNGLFGAPPIAVFVSDQVHATIKNALRMAGIGEAHIRVIPSDNQGRMRLDAFSERLKTIKGQPVIVSLQAGNVNTGAFEPIDAVADLMSGHNAWIHVDGAFGLWAAVSPKLRHLLHGFERADSWATDAHKWLNVPYDSGIVLMKRPSDHRSLKKTRCAYAGGETDGKRDGSIWTPENSRRARAFVLYAAIRSLGRSGVREIIERCCELSRQFAEAAACLPNAYVLNEVVLNQVLLRFELPDCPDVNAFHEALASEIQSSGLCWIGTTQWKDRTVLRVSISNWSTDADVVSESVQLIRETVGRMTGI